MSVAADPAATPAADRGVASGFRTPNRGQLHAVIEAQRILACAPPDPDVIFRLLAETACSVLGACGAIVSQPLADVAIVRGLAGESPRGLGATIPLDASLTGVALRTGTGQICGDWANDPRTGVSPTNDPFSFLVVPLIYEGEAIAALGAHATRLDAFNERDLELLAMLGDVGANRLAHALTIHSRDELQARSSGVLECMTAGLTLLDLDGTVRFANPAALAMFGVTQEDLMGVSNLDSRWCAVHEDGSPWPGESHPSAIALRTGLPQRGHIMGMPRPGGGDLLWLAVNVVPMHDATGAMTGVVCTFDDVTEPRKGARALAASEEHFRLAFDNAPIGMSMISLQPGSEGNYLLANPALCAMLGYSVDELLTRTIPDLTHPEDIEKDRALFTQIVNGETTTVAFDKRFRHKNGETVHAWLTSSVAHGPSGELLYVITHALDMTTRRQQQAELERLALTDTLTGLANRTLLTDRLDQALARLQRVEGSCALLMLDIDRFKLVNDSLGHQVGDALLVEVAARIEAVSRADATVARLGGDEFVVLVEGLTDTDSVHNIAARLLETLRRPYIIDDAADSLVVTASIGVSVADTADRSHTDLYREADLALYRAKDSGRDQYALFDSALRLRVDARMDAENLLRRALAEGHVTPFFQPLIDLGSGHIRSVECLARIALPNGDIVPPAEFVDVAEESGLIVELDARMFELGIQQFAAWSTDPGLKLHTISTNVSARSLEDPTFVERMRRAMTWYGVEGAAICVEITERSLLAPSPAVIESLRRIAELGIAVGLDDFGTGYSALAYLQRFDLTFLKIDRSFVSQLGNRRDDAVVAAVIDLAHALELLVVGEGIETPEQLAALRMMGCDRAQGYLMGRPLPPDELVALMRTCPSW